MGYTKRYRRTPLTVRGTKKQEKSRGIVRLDARRKERETPIWGPAVCDYCDIDEELLLLPQTAGEKEWGPPSKKPTSRREPRTENGFMRRGFLGVERALVNKLFRRGPEESKTFYLRALH